MTLLGDCMTNDGFSAPAFGLDGRANDLGTPMAALRT